MRLLRNLGKNVFDYHISALELFFCSKTSSEGENLERETAGAANHPEPRYLEGMRSPGKDKSWI